MSILIKGMEMPTSCDVCLFDDGVHCMAYPPSEDMVYDIADGKPKWCPLVPVPDHGRLVDADDMQLEWYRLNFDGKISDGTLAYWNYRLSQIPTIIPADKDGAE